MPSKQNTKPPNKTLGRNTSLLIYSPPYFSTDLLEQANTLSNLPPRKSDKLHLFADSDLFRKHFELHVPPGLSYLLHHRPLRPSSRPHVHYATGLKRLRLHPLGPGQPTSTHPQPLSFHPKTNTNTNTMEELLPPQAMVYVALFWMVAITGQSRV